MPHWTHGMDDVPRLEAEARRDPRLTRGARRHSVAGALQLSMARRAEDRAAHATTGQQLLVRCVDDGVDIHERQVALHHLQRGWPNLPPRHALMLWQLQSD